MDPALFKAISDFGLAIVAVVVLSALVWYFIRDLIKQRDLALAGWQSQAAVTEKLAEALRDRNMLDERLIQNRAGR